MDKASTKNRLSKFLASAGVASRRACEELIFDGRVKVNGIQTLIPQTPVCSRDVILVDDKRVTPVEKKVYYVLNKPPGYLCTAKKTGTTKLVLDLFQDVPYRLFTVGRLDKDTQGLLLVTNDGHFANEVIHPSSDINKEYLAKVDLEVTSDHLSAISNGTLVEGVFVKPVRVLKMRRGTLKITISEGKKREVRLLLEAAGLKTKELTRIRIGGLLLGTLPVGAWREMTDNDRKLIFT
ncbi:MAG: pseudouridine synthase [Parachlamydiaceae bacterium]